jgi:NADH dehydrogenase [ubiquinone] 1 alpha subcomplex assembly factor 6
MKTVAPNRRSAGGDGLSQAALLVRRHDRDRYQTALFAPVARREALFALYAFNYEIARVREAARKPMLGQIRLQWWRENIAAAFEGDMIRQHPVVEAVTAAIRENVLTRAHFERLIEARERDLGAEPPASLVGLEDYAEGTSAPLVQLALEVLGAAGPAATEAGRHVGIAYALAGLLRAIPFDARLGHARIGAEIPLAAIADRAAQHLREARTRRGAIPRAATAALLPAVVATRYLARFRAAACDPFAGELAAPDPLQAWRLAAAALLGRF